MAPRRACRSRKPASASPRSDGKLYAFGYRYPAAGSASIKSLSDHLAKVERVTLLGPTPQPVKFQQTAEALVVTLPAAAPIAGMPYTLRIEGSQGSGVA